MGANSRAWHTRIYRVHLCPCFSSCSFEAGVSVRFSRFGGTLSRDCDVLPLQILKEYRLLRGRTPTTTAGNAEGRMSAEHVHLRCQSCMSFSGHSWCIVHVRLIGGTSSMANVEERFTGGRRRADAEAASPSTYRGGARHGVRLECASKYRLAIEMRSPGLSEMSGEKAK